MCDNHLDFLKYFAGVNYCSENKDSRQTMNILNAILSVIVACLLALQGKKSIAKVKQISSPKQNVPWAETFSVFSLYIVRILQVLVFTSILSNILNVVGSALQDNYGHVYYND